MVSMVIWLYGFLRLEKFFYLQAEIILPASRNFSTCEQKTFYLRAENIIFIAKRAEATREPGYFGRKE
jgi:hypothetical protein